VNNNYLEGTLESGKPVSCLLFKYKWCVLRHSAATFFWSVILKWSLNKCNASVGTILNWVTLTILGTKTKIWIFIKCGEWIIWETVTFWTTPLLAVCSDHGSVLCASEQDPAVGSRATRSHSKQKYGRLLSLLLAPSTCKRCYNLLIQSDYIQGFIVTRRFSLTLETCLLFSLTL